MEIVDAHHHLWDTGHLDYPLFRSNPILNRPFVLEDYERIAAKNRVSRSVCVEATSADSFAEVRWLLDQSKRSSVLTRLVLRAPVERPDHRDCLDRLLELDDERIVGVRRSFEFEPPDFPARDETIAGVKTLAEYGLSFDLVLYHSSLPAVLTLVRACPEVRFVLDHLGKPDIRQGLHHPWRDQIAELATLSNVQCKVSGLTTEADHQNWKKEDLKPYINHALRCFGWDRVLFGSDWPVCRMAGGYEAWLEALNWAIRDASAANKEKLFRENATRVYRL